LGWIAGGMLVTDIFIERQFGVVDPAVKIAAEVIGALFVVLVGKWIISRRRATKENTHGSV
jgi:SNF family Na+-dependent transporter